MILLIVIGYVLPVTYALWSSLNGHFAHGEAVTIYGSKLTSQNGKSDYFYRSPIFGELTANKKRINQNIGQALIGDASMPIGFKVHAGMNSSCQFLYSAKELDDGAVEELLDEIRTETKAHLMAAGLCSVSGVNQYGQSLSFPQEGFLIGPYGMFGKEVKAILNNHLLFRFGYEYDNSRKSYQIRQFFAEASSESQKPLNSANECLILQDDSPLVLIKGSRPPFALSYEVQWIPASLLPGNGLKARNYYLRLNVLLFSMVINLLLFAVLFVLIRSSFSRSLFVHGKAAEVEVSDESGWKLIHGDVFRTPARSELLTVFVGAGLHIAIAILLGLSYPLVGNGVSFPGKTVNSVIVAYVICGFIPSCIVGAIYRCFSKSRPLRTALYTSQLYPWMFTAAMLFGNLAVLFKYPTAHVASYKSLINLNVVSLTCALPVAMIGFYYGYKKDLFQPPRATNKIPRQIPCQPRYLNFVYCSLLYGLIPFNVIFFELRLFFDVVWKGGLLDHVECFAAGFFMFLTVSASMSMLVTYLLLQNEDYRWWWKSFAVSSGVAFYLLLYSVYYAVSSLTFPGAAEPIIYMANSVLICCTAMILSGSAGFLGSFLFVRHVYGYLKVN